MRNYICKWPNGDVVLISARDKQEVRQGPFALELIPKVPSPPATAGQWHDPGRGLGNEPYVAPENPLTRPRILRWAGNNGNTFYADLYQEAGGQLKPEEAAALRRWRQATAAQQQRNQQPAAEDRQPWVTVQQLQESGMMDCPNYVQYGSYTGRLLKKITKAFFPRTYEVLKALAGLELFDVPEEYGSRDTVIEELRAAVAADVKDEEKERERDLQEAKLWVDALAGDREALLKVMTDQTVNVYGAQPHLSITRQYLLLAP
eukprot:gene8054-8249_t